MATVVVTESTFRDVVKGSGPSGIVLLDWWASWCGPCRAFAPIYEQASERHPDATFGKVDTDAEQGLAGAFAIHSIPTLMIFREGILLFSQPGTVPGPVLDDLLRQARALDMARVRAEVAAEAAAADKPEAPGE